MRLAGGSLAVGIIDRIMTAREVIDSIVHDAEHIMSREGNYFLNAFLNPSSSSLSERFRSSSV